jgi:hypothetical protein
VRRWLVRMVIEANTEHPDDEPYYPDDQLPYQLREWMDDALYDRDDQPVIMWTEFTRLEVTENGTHVPPAPGT